MRTANAVVLYKIGPDTVMFPTLVPIPMRRSSLQVIFVMARQ